MERSNLLLVLAAAMTIAVSGCKKEEDGGGDPVGGDPAGNAGGGGDPVDGGIEPVGGDPVGGDSAGNTGGGGDPAGTTGGDPVGGDPVGGDPAGGGGGNEPSPGALEKGATCDPRNDQCGRGLICQETGEDEAMNPVGRCFSTCDTLSDPPDCENNELCAPFEECAANAARCPGFCLPSDDCEPCSAEDACGRPATCGLASPITFCVASGEAQAGEPCDNTEIFCAAPNLCVPSANGAVCKAPCGGEACGQNDTCPGEGETCIDLSADYNGLNIKYCHKPCDIYEQTGCGEGEACTVFNESGDDGAWVGSCSPVNGAVGTGVQGDACVPDDQTYFGDCNPGHICRNFFDEMNRNPVCNGFCDAVDQSLCGEVAGCVIPFFNEPLATLGVCVGECEVFGEVGQCGEGLACDFGFIGARGGEPEVALGVCVAGEETVQTGDPCQANPNTGENNCAPGNLCAALEQGGATTCIQLCDTIEGSGHTCAPGTMCLTGVFGSQDNPSQVIGACVPEQGANP
ncbi:MAG: hypothetical protein ACOYM9_25105 [Bradymonadia bacterium]